MSQTPKDKHSIVFEALDHEPDHRDAFIRQTCGDDTDLLSEVQRLMSRIVRAEDLPDVPVVEFSLQNRTPPMVGDGPEQSGEYSAGHKELGTDSEPPGAPLSSKTNVSGKGGNQLLTRNSDLPQVSGYEILGEIARGGMGIVYKARQIQADRIVALKMLLSQTSDDESLERFRREARAIARLQHPGIVQIFEVGEHRGVPFFSLELCSQGNLDQYLSATPLSPQDAARLVAGLAEAIEVAHNAKVIHRDLKPGNVLLTLPPGESISQSKETDRLPLSRLLVKVTDFGLARKLDEATQTQTGVIMGTPSYMAPEQAAGKEKVGPLADVYALGAILYECLTGKPPFQAETNLETIFLVLHQAPVSLRKLQPTVPKDLETICLKCLRKVPSHRYTTARELAEDLTRFLDGKSILARPVGHWERSWRWCLRNPIVAGLLATVAVVLVGAILGMAWASAMVTQKEQQVVAKGQEVQQEKENTRKQKAAAEKQRKRAEESERAATQERQRRGRLKFVKQLERVDEIYHKDPDSALELLHDYNACPIDLRNSAWHYYHNLCQPKRDILTWTDRGRVGLRRLAFSVDGKLLVAGGGLGRNEGEGARVWDVATGKPIKTWVGHRMGVSSVAISSNNIVATASDDRTIQLWDLAERQPIATFPGFPRDAQVAFDAAGTILTAVGSSTALGKPSEYVIKRWNIETRNEIPTTQVLKKDKSKWLTLSPNGKFVALQVQRNTDGKTPVFEQYVFDIRTGKRVATLVGQEKSTSNRVFDSSGKHFASLCTDNLARVWDLSQKQPRVKFQVKGTGRLTLTEDARYLAIARFGHVELWDTQSGKLVASREERGKNYQSLVYDRHRQCFAFCKFRPPIRLWYPLGGKNEIEVVTRFKQFSSFAVSPDLEQVIVTDGKSLRWLDFETGKLLANIDSDSQVHRLLMSLDGTTVAAVSFRNGNSQQLIVRFWEQRTRKLRATIDLSKATVEKVYLGPRGRTFVTIIDRGRLRLWDTSTGRPLPTVPVSENTPVFAAALSHDGKTLVTSGEGDVLRVADARTGQPKLSSFGRLSKRAKILIGPNGKIVAASEGNECILWDLRTGSEIARLNGHTDSILCLAFSRDGQILGTGSEDSTIRLWDTRVGECKAVITGHTEGIASLMFAKQGTILVSRGKNKTIRLWDLQPTNTYAFLKPTYGKIRSTTFDKTGKFLRATVQLFSENGVPGPIESRYWDLTTGVELRKPPKATFVAGTMTTSDGKLEAQVDDETSIIRIVRSQP